MAEDDVIVGASSGAMFQGSRPASARLRSARSRKLDAAGGAGAGPVLSSEDEGPFWFEAAHNIVVDGKRVHRGITTRERQQLRELVKSGFFSEDVLRNIVVKLNDESSDTPRLRAYDWAVTNYAKGHPMVMLVQKADGGGADVVDPNLAYEGELRKLHRLLFDPFRRGTHVFFEIDGVIHRSTAGQLTFIKWCLENGVDKYVEANLAMIRRHMARATKRRASAMVISSESYEAARGAGAGASSAEASGAGAGTAAAGAQQSPVDSAAGSPAAKRRRRELTKAPTRMVRGVLMTAFDITTDTEREMRASRAANLAARASQLAHALGEEVGEEEADVRKALELAHVLLHEAEMSGDPGAASATVAAGADAASAAAEATTAAADGAAAASAAAGTAASE